MNSRHTPLHFLNGKLVTEENLLIPVRDLGFLRGYAVFDYLVTYNKRPFLLEKHLNRLFNSARLIDLAIPWSKEQVSEWVRETLEANADGDEKGVRIVISGGVSNSLVPGSTPTICILADSHHPFPKEWYEKGIAIKTVKHTRYEPGSKTNNYIEGVRQAKQATLAGFIEPVYYDDTQVFEGSTSNIFGLIDGVLVTPKTNILPGATRDTVLSHTKISVPVEERDFSREELLRATEVFLTSSNKEVMPVTVIDGKPVGDGTVGAVTKEAMEQFREFIELGKW